eukprot:c21948_g1_i1 orf=351-1241(-)
MATTSLLSSSLSREVRLSHSLPTCVNWHKLSSRSVLHAAAFPTSKIWTSCLGIINTGTCSTERFCHKEDKLVRPFSQTSRKQFSYCPFVKMCGITNVNDAIAAAKAGADYIGIILWPMSKRSVSVDEAKVIAHVAKDVGAEPVAVFVDEDADTIQKMCTATGITLAQLHGDGARSALSSLPSSIQVIYVLQADKDGTIQTDFPPRNEVDWILVDSLRGGSGMKFDWTNLQLPKFVTKHGWLLAGGLNSENVGTAISALKPDGVDVSSGICGMDGILKDPMHIATFMDAVRSCKTQL